MGKNYYIFKNGTLKRKDDSLVFYHSEEENKYTYLPVNDIDSLYLFGEINMNTKFVNFIAQEKKVIHFFNYYGFYTGSFYPRETLNSGYLLVRQVSHYTDKNKRLSLAKMIVEGAIYNILCNLKYYRNKERDLDKEIEGIEKFKNKISEADNIPFLMGLEGNARELYYRSFNKIIKQNIEFEKRVRRPPDNMMNALISFLNSLVYTLCLSEIYKTQLNPTISFLHEPGVKRFSLSLDIAEIFKPLIADRLIFSLLNKEEITEDDFDKRLNYVYLKEKARKIILKRFDEKVSTILRHRKLKRNISYRTLIRLELYKLIKHILGEQDYEPFKIYW